MVKALILSAIVALAACTTTGGSFCEISDPIRLSPEVIDQLSDEEVARVLTHNEQMRRLCGVKP